MKNITKASIEEIYRNNYQDVFNILRARGSTAEQAEDSIQDAILSIYNMAGSDKNSDFILTRLYFITSCVRAYIDIYRSHGSHISDKSENQFEDILYDQALNDFEINFASSQGLDKDLVKDIIANDLKGGVRDAIMFVYIEGNTAQEVSDFTGVKLGTILARLTYGYKIIREIYNVKTGSNYTKPAVKLKSKFKIPNEHSRRKDRREDDRRCDGLFKNKN